MAKLEYSAVDDVLESMSALAEGVRRHVIRSVVEAGAAKYGEMLTQEIDQKHHLSGDMAKGVKPGKYYESIGGGYVYVYPQGKDSRGVDNAQKAFIINNGRGGKVSGKLGDRFITKLGKTAADPVQAAMAAKYEECMKQYTK